MGWSFNPGAKDPGAVGVGVHVGVTLGVATGVGGADVMLVAVAAGFGVDGPGVGLDTAVGVGNAVSAAVDLAAGVEGVAVCSGAAEHATRARTEKTTRAVRRITFL